MKSGLVILCVIPIALGLVALNCVGWELVRLRAGLPVEMGMGWPWCYYTYPVNRVGVTEWHLVALAQDLAVALGVLVAVGGAAFLLTRHRRDKAWR